jgi:hypothetical protein
VLLLPCEHIPHASLCLGKFLLLKSKKLKGIQDRGVEHELANDGPWPKPLPNFVSKILLKHSLCLMLCMTAFFLQKN